MAQSISKSFCSVPQCRNSKQKQPYLQLHEFPQDVQLRSKWIKAIRRIEGPTFVIRRGVTFVCSQHFASADYNVDGSSLKFGAVPSRFYWNTFHIPLTPRPSSVLKQCTARLGVDVPGQEEPIDDKLSKGNVIPTRRVDCSSGSTSIISKVCCLKSTPASGKRPQHNSPRIAALSKRARKTFEVSQESSTSAAVNSLVEYDDDTDITDDDDIIILDTTSTPVPRRPKMDLTKFKIEAERSHDGVGHAADNTLETSAVQTSSTEATDVGYHTVCAPTAQNQIDMATETEGVKVKEEQESPEQSQHHANGHELCELLQSTARERDSLKLQVQTLTYKLSQMAASLYLATVNKECASQGIQTDETGEMEDFKSLYKEAIKREKLCRAREAGSKRQKETLSEIKTLIQKLEQSTKDQDELHLQFKMYCPFCGLVLENLTKCCISCGKDISFLIKTTSTMSRIASEDHGSSQSVSIAKSAVHQFTDERKPFSNSKKKAVKVKNATRPQQTTTSLEQHTPSDFNKDGLTVPDVIMNLSQKINTSSCSRFNINRADVWDGALRGFKRSTYDPTYGMIVKFTDDVGLVEGDLDTSGPTREFLTLLMDSMKKRRIFEGKANAKYLSFDHKAVEDDEYFYVGRMIAVSIVHGGPGPCCLSPNLFLYLIGKVKAMEAPIEDIPDEEVKKAFLEIKNTTSLTELRRLTEKHSSMLQTACCYRFMRTLEDKKKVVDDYIQWYFIYRNHLSIQRFKEGLSTLDFLSALEQHPSLISFMCCAESKLTADAVENVFQVHLSPPGSTRRQEEARVLSYWRDYLLYLEEGESSLSLEDVLMFGTGLREVPPATIQPQLLFQISSHFPVANVHSNTIKLPISHGFKEFQQAMDFGIKNIPGFGLP